MRTPSMSLVLVLVLPLVAVACRYDPVPQEIIDDLGPEQGTADANHRPGQPCLACHSAYAGASPQMTFGGTVFTENDDGDIIPAAGVTVRVLDSAGNQKLACSNGAGNFFLDKKDGKEVEFPLTVKVGLENGGTRMRSLIGRDGSCGSCHKLPDPEADPPRHPVTGAGHDSAGLIMVGFNNTGDCGGAP